MGGNTRHAPTHQTESLRNVRGYECNGTCRTRVARPNEGYVMRQHHIKKLLLILILAIVSLLSIIAITQTVYARNYAISNVEWIDYTIEPGDTLWRIARVNCPATVQIQHWLHEIKQANGITNAGVLQVGQIIKIPVGR
jgi:hypothetical protein